MRTAIDTNLLIILLRGKPAAEARQIADALIFFDRLGQLIISPIVWSELRVLIGETKLNKFINDLRITVDWELTPAVWSTAAEAFACYLKRRRQSGSLYHCSACGSEITVRCPGCKRIQGFPRHVLPDFIIGAHALHRASLLLTGDKGIPVKYYPELKVVNPLEEPDKRQNEHN